MMAAKENGNGLEPMSNGSRKADASSLSVASDLIRMMDSAFYEMSSAAATAAKEAEDARRNAHAVSELARRFSSASNSARGGGGGAGALPSSVVSPALNTRNTESQPEITHTLSIQEEVSEENLTYAVQESTALFVPVVDETSTESSPQSAEIDESAIGERKRKDPQPHPEVTSERLARSHADDVLALSLELERTKETLEEEHSSRHQMKAALQEAKSRNAQLEAQVQKLMNDLRSQREDDARKADSLQQQLTQAQIRVDAAEEDAQLALDLAKGNAEDREMVETWLQRSLQEVQVLRDQLQHAGVSPKAFFPASPQPQFNHERTETKKRVVRFADSPTEASCEASSTATPKSLVVAGKSLLIHSGGKPSSPSGSRDLHNMHSIVWTPEKSAERRRKLRERIGPSNQNETPLSSSSTLVDGSDTAGQDGIGMDYSSRAIEHCQGIVSLLRESGKRLRLGGHWWTRDAPDELDPDNVEAMTRQYCHSVEMKLDRQTGEMSELHALCDYLEQNLEPCNTPSSARKSLE